MLSGAPAGSNSYTKLVQREHAFGPHGSVSRASRVMQKGTWRLAHADRPAPRLVTVGMKWEHVFLVVKALLVILAISLALLSGSVGANASGDVATVGEVAAVSPKQVCGVVQSATLASAVGALSKLLPPRWRPGRTLTALAGIAASTCPWWARPLMRIGNGLVERKAPARVDPTIFAPITSLMAARTMDVTSGSAYAFVSWFGLGVDRYQEQTFAGGSWDNPLNVSGPWSSVWRQVAPGVVYRFYIRGLDARGRAITSWAKSDQFRLNVFDSSWNRGGWVTRSGYRAYRGTLLEARSGSTAESLSYTVDGFAMAIAAPTFPRGGTADVYVDGTFARRISLQSRTNEVGRLVFSWRWPSSGRHYVRLDPVSGLINLDAGLVLAHPS